MRLSHEDKDSAGKIGDILGSKYGFSCWIYIRAVKGGDNFKKAIPGAIDGARVIVFVQSENSLNFRKAPKQIKISFDTEKKRMPFKVERAQREGEIRYDLRGVDFIDGTI